MKAIAAVFLMLVVFAAFILTICACSLDMAVAFTLWNHPPEGWHIRLFGWNGLLVINMIATFLLGGFAFFQLFILPRKLDQ